jgi:hypothetical protein
LFNLNSSRISRAFVLARVVAGLAVLVAMLAVIAVAPLAIAATSLRPGVAGVVQDACTGLPVFGATETLVPLSGQQPQSPPIRLGPFFAYQTLPAQAYGFQVSAPGYQPLVGAPITIAPAPAQLPLGDSVTESFGAVVRLFPTRPCFNGPLPLPKLPSIVGSLTDAITGQAIPCGDNTGGDPNVPPPCATVDVATPDSDVPGFFVFANLPAGDHTLAINAPGYKPFAIPLSLPGPYQQGGTSLTLTTTLDIELAPCSTC